MFTRADALRKLLKESGVTYASIEDCTAQDDCGQRINKSTIERIVNGKTKRPHRSTIPRILACIGKTEDDLDALLRGRSDVQPVIPTQGEPLPPRGLSATVPASTQSEGDVSATGEGEAASGEHYVKELLFGIYQRLTPERRISWVQDGLNAAHMPGKSTAGGEQ